jgi:hypothetical protein
MNPISGLEMWRFIMGCYLILLLAGAITGTATTNRVVVSRTLVDGYQQDNHTKNTYPTRAHQEKRSLQRTQDYTTK